MEWKVDDVIGLRVVDMTTSGWPKVRVRGGMAILDQELIEPCLLYTSPSPRD